MRPSTQQSHYPTAVRGLTILLADGLGHVICINCGTVIRCNASGEGGGTGKRSRRWLEMYLTRVGRNWQIIKNQYFSDTLKLVRKLFFWKCARSWTRSKFPSTQGLWPGWTFLMDRPLSCPPSTLQKHQKVEIQLIQSGPYYTGLAKESVLSLAIFLVRPNLK